ncbi:hypothetical protein CA603_31825 [Paraburkholderia hospita]|nr:hypothetical protein CA603_31825 [Paraburkholderia hospita]
MFQLRDARGALFEGVGGFVPHGAIRQRAQPLHQIRDAVAHATIPLRANGRASWKMRSTQLTRTSHESV